MGTTRNINEARRRLAAMIRTASAVTFAAIVESVDEEKRTCTVKDDDVVFQDVLLYAVTDESLKGATILPKVGSSVLVSKIGGSNMLFVSMFSEVDKIVATIGEKTTVELTAETLEYKNDKVSFHLDGDNVEIDGAVTFNGGDNGGAVILQKLQDNLDSLKEYVEGMNTAILLGFTGVGEGPAATGSGGKGAYMGAMAGKAVVFVPMENDKVKH